MLVVKSLFYQASAFNKLHIKCKIQTRKEEVYTYVIIRGSLGQAQLGPSILSTRKPHDLLSHRSFSFLLSVGALGLWPRVKTGLAYVKNLNILKMEFPHEQMDKKGSRDW